MTAQTRRRVFVISVGIIVVLAIGYGFVPKPVRVETAEATRGPLRVTVEEEARTRVRDRFVVTAPVPGFLHRIELEPADTVKKGRKISLIEPLHSAALDPRSRAEAESAVDSARAALNNAKERARAAAADAEYARKRADRMKSLVEAGHVSTDDYEQAEASAKKADAVRDSAVAASAAAEADLMRAKSVLEYSGAAHSEDSRGRVIVRSPVNGTVLKLHRQSEGVVNAGDPLMDIGDPRNLEVKAEVLSADAVKIRTGMPVIFERWGGGELLEGKVRVVEPSGFTKVSSLGVEEQRVLVIIDFTSPRSVWQGLGDGFRLDASFVIWEGKDVLQVPESALFRKGEGWAVFVIEDKRAKTREVKIGRRSGITAEVLAGVDEGSLVIIHPDDAIKDGVKVNIRDAASG